MSHDQKPPRSRVVALTEDPQRRRHDAPPIVADGKAGGGGAGGHATGGKAANGKAAGGGKARILLALMFLAAAIAGGAGIETMLPT